MIYVYLNAVPMPWHFDAEGQFVVTIEELDVASLCDLLRRGDVAAVGEEAARAVERVCRRRANVVSKHVEIRGGDVAVAVFATRDPAAYGRAAGVAPFAAYKYTLGKPEVVD